MKRFLRKKMKKSIKNYLNGSGDFSIVQKNICRFKIKKAAARHISRIYNLKNKKNISL